MQDDIWCILTCVQRAALNDDRCVVSRHRAWVSRWWLSDFRAITWRMSLFSRSCIFCRSIARFEIAARVSWWACHVSGIWATLDHSIVFWKLLWGRHEKLWSLGNAVQIAWDVCVLTLDHDYLLGLISVPLRPILIFANSSWRLIFVACLI